MINTVKSALTSLILVSLSSLIFSNSAMANDKDREIEKLVSAPDVLKQGQGLFEQICASCHAKDLSGASGFNLKDGEWVHGDKPSQIVNNVKNGFMNAGMPGFGQMFSEDQIDSIVAYLLSKREGWSDLTYKVFQLSGSSDKTLSADKLIKSGKQDNNLPDFAMPEVKHYALVLEGDFYTYKDQVTKLWTGRPNDLDFRLEINGQVTPRSHEWNPTWVLQPGKQHLKLTFFVHDEKFWRRNIPLIVTNEDLSIKLFPASQAAKKIMEGKKLDIKVEQETIVQRKKVHSLPPYSISVGMVNKINYAFNTRSCAIVGLWQGDMLNVGPNISGRGQDGSLPLGKWKFKPPEHPSVKADKECKYKGYNRNPEPQFNFEIDGVKVSLNAELVDNNSIKFNYKTAKGSELVFDLPQVDDVIWSTSQNPSTDDNAVFSITAKIK